MRRLALLPLVPLLGLMACSSGVKEAPFVIEPAPVILRVGERAILSARPQDPVLEEPQWDIQDMDGGTLVKSKGTTVTYAAPAQAGKYRIVVSAPKADGQRARQVVDIEVIPAVQVEPGAPTLAQGATLTFQAKVKGVPQSKITWSLEEEEGGRITPEGLYTAPSRPGTYHVVASLEGYPGIVGTGTIRVL